jgi:hypothetical protein
MSLRYDVGEKTRRGGRVWALTACPGSALPMPNGEKSWKTEGPLTVQSLHLRGRIGL